MQGIKDGNYHKNMKMASLIKDQMSQSLEQQSNLNIMQYKQEMIKSTNRNKDKDNLQPNSNKANRIKVYEQITNSYHPKVINASKSSTIYFNNNNQQSIKQKQENKTKEKEINNAKVSTTLLSTNLKCLVIQESIANNNNSKEVLDQFENYYLEKFLPFEKNAPDTKSKFLIKEENEKKTILTQKEPIYFDVSLNYSLGLSYKLPSNANLICYHKEYKWFAYLHHNLILIEHFQDDSNRKQLILNNSKVPLSSIKLSYNGKILYSSQHSRITYQNNTSPPFILFYSYKNNSFKFLSQIDFPSNETILDYSMSPTNSFCIVTSKDSTGEYYLSCLDYINKENLIKTSSRQEFSTIRWNKYVSEIEFSTFGTDSYSIWTIITKEVIFEEKKRKLPVSIDKEASITALDYTPPLTLKCIIMLIIALSNGTILVYDYDANVLKAKYTSLDVFQEIGGLHIDNIAVSINSITVMHNNKMRHFKMPLLSQINEDNLNLFSIKNKVDMEFDSNIICSDFNTMLSTCQGILMTSAGYLYYFNFNEESNLRLFHFNSPDYPIKDILIINNNIKQISLQNYANSDSIAGYNIDNDDNEGYTIVSSHEKGIIKIWSIPEYYLKYTIEVKEEICSMTQVTNNTKIIVSYNSGTIRIIDVTKGELIGQTQMKAFIGDSNYLKLIKCFPEEKYFFGCDNNKNTLHLVTIDSYNPFSIHSNIIYSHPENINEIELSIEDPFNQFLISDSSNIVKVFSRKYKTIIQNLSFDKSIPQYDCVDTFDVNAFISNSAFPHIVNKLKLQFSPNIKEEPDKVYISTSMLLIQRDFNFKVVTKLISFDIPLLNYHIASNSSYLLYVFNEKIKYSQFASIVNDEPQGNIIPLPFTDTYISSIISYDDKLCVIAYSFGFSIFELKNIF